MDNANEVLQPVAKPLGRDPRGEPLMLGGTTAKKRGRKPNDASNETSDNGDVKKRQSSPKFSDIELAAMRLLILLDNMSSSNDFSADILNSQVKTIGEIFLQNKHFKKVFASVVITMYGAPVHSVVVQTITVILETFA